MSELKTDIVHALFYGRNGIGKTTLACHFPPPLALISLEMDETGGAASVKSLLSQREHKVFRPPMEKVKGKGTRKRFTIPISQWLEKMVDALHEDTYFNSVVFDNGTVLDEYMLAEVCKWPDVQVMNRFAKVSSDQYTERSEQMRIVLQPFFQLEKHFVLLANEKDHAKQDDQDRARRVAIPQEAQMGSFFAAAMGQGVVRWAQDASTYVCQLFMDAETKKVGRIVGMGKNRQMKYREEGTGRFVRRLRMKYHPNFMARGRIDNPDDVPDYIGGETAKEMFDNFWAVTQGTYTAPEEVIEEAAER